MINEKINATGELKIVLRDKDGNVKMEKTEKNLVVTSGKTFIASRMVGTGSAVMSHMAVGTSTTAPVAGQTTLVSEIARAAIVSGNSAANVVTYSAVFAAGVGTGAITEAGILNAGAAGTMLSRTVFSVVNKEADDSLTINWQITIN
jgi:hypothetical protein